MCFGASPIGVETELNGSFINHDKIKEAIKNASLEGFINSLPNRGNTYVGEGGIRISGGQKQRIGLARALYNDPKILILDEATSALDYETEEKIINEITRLKESKIIITLLKLEFKFFSVTLYKKPSIAIVIIFLIRA